MTEHSCRCLFIFVVSTACVSLVSAQDPLRFRDEVVQLTANDHTINKEDAILFTGSSSIKMWSSIKLDFPGYNIINRGFGGSQTTDLIYFFDKLIQPYNPKMIFIYEGDNDLSAGKSPEQVISSMDSLVNLIRQKVSESVPVYIISPKPSVARWHLKDKYVEFNKRMSDRVLNRSHVYFVDVWTPALDGEGNVLKDIFLEDGLHMNKKGYAIWVNAIRKYLP